MQWHWHICCCMVGPAGDYAVTEFFFTYLLHHAMVSNCPAQIYASSLAAPVPNGSGRACQGPTKRKGYQWCCCIDIYHQSLPHMPQEALIPTPILCQLTCSSDALFVLVALVNTLSQWLQYQWPCA